MTVQINIKLTNDGKKAIWNSKNTGINFDLTHIQFGTRNRVATGEESSLVQPKQFTPITNGRRISDDQIRLMATMPGNENYNVAEIGLWSGIPNEINSKLIGYHSVPNGFIAQMVSGIDLVFSYDMVVSADVIDQITIVADTDQSSTFALIAAHVTEKDPHPFYVSKDTAQNITGIKTFTNKAIFSGGLVGELQGNAATAEKLKSERTVSFTGAVLGKFKFDGSTDISCELSSDDLDILLYSPIPYPKTIPPTGFLAMMGQEITEAQHPKLYAIYGSTLTDMRAEFIRGLDTGRGVDGNRTILSSQAATAIGFYVGGLPDDNLISFIDARNSDSQYTDATDGYRRYTSSGDKGTTKQILKSVRPRNVAYNYIVKAG